MAETYKQLGQLRPADTNAASLYSPAAGTKTIIRQIYVCNSSAGALSFRIFHDDNGTTYDKDTALYYDHNVAANDTEVIDCHLYMDDNTGNVAVRSSSANDINFIAYGIELT